MSRKDYIRFAAAVKEALTASTTEAERAIVTALAKEMASIFANDNGNFRRSTFLDACGIQ